MDFPANRFSAHIPAIFGSLLNSLGRLSPVTGDLGAASAGVILLVTVAIPGFFYFKKSKNKPQFNVDRESTKASTFDAHVNGTKIVCFHQFVVLPNMLSLSFLLINLCTNLPRYFHQAYTML